MRLVNETADYSLASCTCQLGEGYTGNCLDGEREHSQAEKQHWEGFPSMAKQQVGILRRFQGFVLAGEGAACLPVLQVSGSAPGAFLGGAFRHKPHAGAASCSGADPPPPPFQACC